jgi:hypothetical protein
MKGRQSMLYRQSNGRLQIAASISASIFCLRCHDSACAVMISKNLASLSLKETRKEQQEK